MNLDNLPNGSEYDPPERIVCAANSYADHKGNIRIIAGVRHACDAMGTALDAFRASEIELRRNSEIQGFLTSKHRFVDRQEAWKLAVERNQIVRRVGGDDSKGGTLYSENLY